MGRVSLFDRIGGKPAVKATIDIFYKKVLADDRVNYFFKDIDMKAQSKKQIMFMTYALGGAPNYSGLSMRKAHETMVNDLGLNEDHFNAVTENLKSTLEELSVDDELIGSVMIIVNSTKREVLNL